MLVCVWLVCVAGWCVGVWVRLRCDGLGLVAMAWARVCMSMCRVCGACLVGGCVFVCFRCVCCVVCDAGWTLLAAVDGRLLCGLTATDWRLGGGWLAWWTLDVQYVSLWQEFGWCRERVEAEVLGARVWDV